MIRPCCSLAAQAVIGVETVDLTVSTPYQDSERMNMDKAGQLRKGVREAYSAAAQRPQDKQEFRAAGFCKATLLHTMRNARTKNPRVLAAEVFAQV